MNGQPHPNGYRQANHAGPAQQGQQGGFRVPSVHEALPFSPFTSISAFNPGKPTLTSRLAA